MSSSVCVSWGSFQAGALRMFLPGLASFPSASASASPPRKKGLSAFEVARPWQPTAAASSPCAWLGRHGFVAAWLDHAPGAVLMSAAIVPIVQTGGASWVGAAAAAIATRWLGGFTPGLFAAVGAVALARWAGSLRAVSVECWNWSDGRFRL